MRLGLGPVFWCELVSASRRWQPFAMRILLLTTLLGTMTLAFANARYGGPDGDGFMSLQDYAKLGEIFAGTLICTQLAIVLLSAPAATAGAVCLDKARGNLLLLLITELSGPEIVLGKLAARLWPVLALVASSLPLLFIATLMGGVSPVMLVVGFTVIIATAIFACSLAFVISVYVAKMYEALLLSYFLITAWLLALPLSYMVWGPFVPHEILAALNPFTAIFAPSSPTYVPWYTYLFLASTLGPSLLFIVWAAWRVRRVTIRQASRGTLQRRLRWSWRNRTRGLSRSPLDWYERHRRRPSKIARFVWGSFVFVAVGSTVWSVHSYLNSSFLRELPASFSVLFQVGVGLLLATVTGIASFTDEHAHGNWEVLLTTPVSTRRFVDAKWYRVFRLYVGIATLPAVMLLLLSIIASFTSAIAAQDQLGVWLLGVMHLLASGALYTSLSVALAVRFRRLAVAAGIGITILVLHTLGSIFLIEWLAPHGMGTVLLTISPIAAQIMVIKDVRQMNTFMDLVTGLAMWSVVYASLAFLIRAWTHRNFDRLIGRMPERGLKRSPPRLPQNVALPAVVGDAGEHEQQVRQPI